MNPFRKRAAIRIAVVSIILSSIASPISWIVARENAEESIVSQAIEETDRLLHHHEAIDLVGADAADNAVLAAKTIAGGLFDIAEIYDKNGRKLAESMTNLGELIEDSMPQHGNPHYTEASYESVYLPNDS